MQEIILVPTSKDLTKSILLNCLRKYPAQKIENPYLLFCKEGNNSQYFSLPDLVSEGYQSFVVKITEPGTYGFYKGKITSITIEFNKDKKIFNIVNRSKRKGDPKTKMKFIAGVK